MHTRKKRILAAALSFIVAPGVGHYLLGARRAAVAWVAAFVIAFAGVAAFGTLSPGVLVVSALLAVAVQVAAAVDSLRPRATRPPPTARVVVAAIAAVVVSISAQSLVRAQVVESFRIPGGSMYPTLEAGDHVLVSKRRRAPEHGDVVAYRAVDGSTYMKRVMASEWETIEVRGSEVWLNQQKLPQTRRETPCTIEEPCVLMNETNGKRTYPIAVSPKDSTLNPKPELRVPLGHIYIMGDARRWSLDSRMTGPVPVRDVIGSAEFVWWPWSRFGFRP